MSPGEALAVAVSETFGNMAFIDAMEAPSPAPEFSTSHIISVGFSRPVRGRIALILSLQCRRMVVENVFGREWDSLSAAEIDDCLLELGNVVAGDFLDAYCGKAGAHDVALPVLLFDTAELPPGGRTVETSFDAEGSPFKAIVTLD
jgi:CheY-specific phosphatase CheX